jgi:glycosyltransferase involved in cell wall biosynthesis
VTKVSIITPLFNKEPYVSETIRSVLAQTMADWEMIVVENGSTDKGPEIVGRFSDSRIRLVTSPKQGPGAARNFGIAQARGNWIQFLDADDLLEPNQLATQLAESQQNPQADILIGTWLQFVDGQPANQTRKCPSGYPTGVELLRDTAIIFTACAPHAAIVRRNIIDGPYLWPESLDCLLAEDTVFWFKLITEFKVSFSRAGGAIYRFMAPGCRTDFDVERWFNGNHAVIQENLKFLEARNKSPTSRQCQSIFTHYLGQYARSISAGKKLIANQAIAEANRWLREASKRGGRLCPSSRLARILGIRALLTLQMLRRRLFRSSYPAT